MKKYTTGEITEMLRCKFPPPRYAFCTEVPNGTGMNKSRSCDAMAIGCWKSTGTELAGFEIKASRSDWMSEIQDPQKAAAFSKYCHHWYIVAPKTVVNLVELPSDWGFMYPTASGNLRIGRPSPLNSPKPIPYEMLSAMLRRAMQCNKEEIAQRLEVQKAYREGMSEGRDASKRSHEREMKRFTEDNENCRRIIEEFEQASGLRIRGYDMGRIAEAVKVVTEVSDFGKYMAKFAEHIDCVRSVVEKAIHEKIPHQED